MSDYERYADYNDIEEDRPKSKNLVLTLIKVLTALVCIAVVGVLAFRMVLFNNYPDSVKNIYFNDELTEYFESTEGKIGAKTQSLRFPYDDPDFGNFFCDHLIVIEGIDQLQITVRYNTASLTRIAEENGISSLDPEDSGIFTYRLKDNYGNVYSELSAAVFDSQVMYRYVRLVFDGVELEGEGAPEYIMLEITPRDAEGGKTYVVPIYENDEDYSDFTEYKLSGKERPGDE